MSVASSRPRRRSGWARWPVLLPALAITAACQPDGQLEGEDAASLEVPAGTQQLRCAGQGPGVVLINGIGDQASSRQWLDVQGQLAQDTRVCRDDRPGTGGSPPPTVAGRGPEALTLELDAVVDHTTNGEVVLVAQSLGGYLARLYAERHPQRVRGIVFLDALDPSVGLLLGTGADDLGDIAMAEEQLDLRALETAAAAVTKLPPDIPVTRRMTAWPPETTSGQGHRHRLNSRRVVGLDVEVTRRRQHRSGLILTRRRRGEALNKPTLRRGGAFTRPQAAHVLGFPL